MKKITRLWQLMLLLVLTSSVAFAQSYSSKTTDGVSGKEYNEVQLKKELLDKQMEATKQVVAEFDGLVPVMQAVKFKKQKSVYKSSKGVLYSQMTLSVNNGGKASQDFSTANDAYDCIIAEDFTVSGGDWDLTKINFLGSWSSAGPAEGFHIEFYADNAGMPGASVAAYTSLPYTDDGAGLFEVWLPAPLTLTDGVTYWMSIQARMDFSVGGQWYWSEHDETAVVGAVGVWQNPGDGFGTGYTTWTAASTVWAGPPPSLNFAFELSDDPIPTCPAPSGMYAGNFTAASADLAWTENGTATLWDVEWGLAGFAQGTGTMMSGLASTSTSLAGLAGATAYDVYYRADCGGSQSTWVGPYTFMLPDYFASITPTTSCQTDNGSFTAGGMAWYEVSLDAGFTYNLSVASCDASCAGDMPVADGDFYFYDTDGMTLLWYVDGLSSCDYDASTWGSANESFTPSATGTYFLEVRDYFDSNADNFTLGYIAEAIPTCLEPTTLSTTDITSASAKLNWVTTGTNTQYEYGVVGFAPGTGAEIGSGSTHNSYADIAGLLSSTSYDWYVRNDCGGGDYSAWVGSTFITADPPPGPHPFPLTEDFEAGFTYFNNANGNTADFVDETTIIHGGAHSVNYGSYSAGSLTILHETGILDLSGTTAPILDFYHIAKTEGGYDKCFVEISIDAGLNYDPIPAAAYTGSGSGYATGATPPLYFDEDDYSQWGTGNEIPDNTWWKKESFDLSAYTVADVRLRFRFTSDGSVQRTGGWFIDDITIYEPTCPAPTSLGVSDLSFDSVNLEWTSPAGSSNIEYGLLGFTVGIDPIGTAAGVTSPYAVSGLNASTEYEFYVQDDCGGGNLSTWAGPYSFTTLTPIGELLDRIEIDPITGVAANLGAEYFNGFLWITGRDDALGHQIYQIDLTTNTVINSYPQGTSSTWGMRDLANDGTYLYAGDDDGFYKIDPTTGVVTTLFTPTGMGTIRALAYDGINFWTKSFGGDIYEFDATGAIINQYSAGVSAVSAYGAAYDASVPCVWWHATGTGGVNDMVQMDMAGNFTGTKIEVPLLDCGDNGSVGGAFMDNGNLMPGRTVFGVLDQATPDVVKVFEAYDTGFPDQTSNYLPLCGETGIPVTGNLTWDFGDNTTTYDLYLGPVGAMVPVVTGAAVGGPTGSYAYSLMGTTEYEWQVVGINATGATESLVYSFTTACDVMVPDYVEDFTTFLPLCWDQADSGDETTGPADFGTSTWTGPNLNIGTGSAKINLYFNNKSDWLLSPFFNLSSGSYEISVDVAVTDWNSGDADVMGSDDFVKLVYTEDGVNWNNVITTWTVADALPNTPTTYTFPLTTTGANVQFGILASDGTVNDAEDYDFHIDNFAIEATTYTVAGVLEYATATPQLMDNCTVSLYDASNVMVGQAVTDANGEFAITGIADGDYTWDFTTNKARGGTDLGDMNVVLDHIGGTVMVGLPFVAADVSADAMVDLSDLNGVLDEIGGGTVWAAPDFVTEGGTITVSGANVIVTLETLSSGDPAPSYSIPLGK